MNIPSGPLAGRYPFVATMAILALVPYLALSSALSPLIPFIQHDLHMSQQTLALGLGMGTAGYAVGTVLAVMLAQPRHRNRELVAPIRARLMGQWQRRTPRDPFPRRGWPLAVGGR